MGGWRHMTALALALACGPAALAAADLRQAQAEPNLDKRSKLALENAAAVLLAMEDAYAKGDSHAVAADAAEIQESVELAYTSLSQTGKDPRKSPKWFERAEIQTHDLLRRLDSFQADMSFKDRPLLDQAKASVQRVHDSLLMGFNGGQAQMKEGKQ